VCVCVCDSGPAVYKRHFNMSYNLSIVKPVLSMM